MKKGTSNFLRTLSPFLWFCLLMSLTLSMLYRRASHEPGAGDYIGLFVASRICFFFGLLGTLAIQVLFLYHKEKRIRYLWILNLVATVIYAPIFVITLFMMV